MGQLYFEKFVQDDKKDWLVLLHGFGGNSRMWLKQIAFFRKKYNLFVLDLPGHGKSKEGIAKKGYKKFTDLADVIVKTLKENGIDKATFLCVSLGTLVFAGLLIKYPEMVNGAILCGGVSGVNKFLEFIIRIANLIKMCLPYTFIMFICSYVLLPLKEHKLSREFFIKESKTMGRKEFMAWINLCLSDLNVLKKMKDYGKKILFIEGNEDYIFLHGVKKKIKQLKNGSLKIIEHCGHVCNIQKAKEFNQVALEYIQKELNFS